MPYGIYRIKEGEECEIKIYYSACEAALRKCKEGEELVGIYEREKDARFFAEIEEERIKYRGSVGPIEERARA
ncbi:MAG: hypothetical protein QXJ96_02375 [Candidatus Aenigmatarchaeota archaeon]|nr:hypothetical protein [Candidatus Aenigmarchaeota archaeon]